MVTSALNTAYGATILLPVRRTRTSEQTGILSHHPTCSGNIAVQAGVTASIASDIISPVGITKTDEARFMSRALHQRSKWRQGRSSWEVPGRSML